ncbi:MAG: hypothetical protein HY000_15270 [Planctomycetes bacterium]|nr:hypothetical protein [Planctomycetota bacterium]
MTTDIFEWRWTYLTSYVTGFPQRRPRCLHIAGRSAELDAMNNMLHKGSKLEDIRSVESVIADYESDYLRSQPTEVRRRKRPWWKLW